MIRSRSAALAQSGYRFSLGEQARGVCAAIMLKPGDEIVPDCQRDHDLKRK